MDAGSEDGIVTLCDISSSGSHSNEARDSSDVGFALLSRFAKTKQANDGIFQSH
jgi:hypothetical protein